MSVSWGGQSWPVVSGKWLPPFFRHIALAPIGESGFSARLWKDFENKVTTVVFPYEDLSPDMVSQNSSMHFFTDLGRWDLRTSELLIEKVNKKVPRNGWSGGWILNGDLESMVTNLREFEAFRKKLDAIRPGSPLYLACPISENPAQESCLPKSLEPFFFGVIWDVAFHTKNELECLSNALHCSLQSEQFWSRFRNVSATSKEGRPWSVRFALTSVAALGKPNEVIQAFYSYFINEPHSVHLMLAVDAPVAKKIAAGEAPFANVKTTLTNLSAQQVARNMDLASDIESPLFNEGKIQIPKSTKLTSEGGVDMAFSLPFAMTRYTLIFDAKQVPNSVSIFADDGESVFFIKKIRLPKQKTPYKMYTEAIFFPWVKRLVFKPEKGRLQGAASTGWSAVWKTK